MCKENWYHTIHDLFWRANVMIRTIGDDPRWILNVLFKIYKDGLSLSNLIYFDAHDDAAVSKSSSQLLKKIGVKLQKNN